MVIILGGPPWLVLLSWKISLTAQIKVDSSLPMSLILVHSSLDTILILLFFLSFHYSPEQKFSMVTNSVLNFPLFWQLKKSFNQKHNIKLLFIFVYNNTAPVCFLLWIWLKINSAFHPSLSIYKTCSRKTSHISGRRKTTGLPSRLPDVCVITYQENNITLQQTPRNHAMSNKLNF